MAAYMAWPVLLVMMMANMLLGKNILLHTKNKAYIIGLEDNGSTTPEHGKDYWGVNIDVNLRPTRPPKWAPTRAPTWAPTRAPTWAPTRAPTWAPPRPVCSTQPGSYEKKIVGYNQGWIDFSCMSGGSDRRHRLKRQVMPMACLRIKAVVTACGPGLSGSFNGDRTWRLNKVTLNMNGVFVKIILSILSPLLLGTADTYFQVKAKCDKKSTCRITPTADYFDSTQDCGWADHAPSGSDWKVPKLYIIYSCNGGTDMTTVHKTKPTRAPTMAPTRSPMWAPPTGW